MSTFNQVRKITYSSNPNDVVALSEFIVMSDARAKEKYLILKFVNNVAQKLSEFAFEITEYDNQNNIIEKLTLNQTNVEAEASKEFVPNAKLKVHYDTEKISYKLVSAKFERVIWHDGEFVKIPFDIDEFVKREDTIIEEPWEKEKLDAARQKIDKMEAKKFYKVNKKRLKGKEIEIKSIRKQNISKKPKVITIILSILFIGAIVGVLIYYNFKTTRFSYQDFDYKLLNNNNEVSVERYFGKDKNAVVPKTFTILTNTYKVTEVEPYAFKQSTITSVEFTSNIKIQNEAFVGCTKLAEIKGGEFVTFVGNDAFRGCSSLSKVTLDNATEVGQKAFADCASLTTASFAKATMMSTSLYHDDALSKLSIYDTMQDKLSSLFIAEEGEVLPVLREVSIHRARIPANFFEGMTNIKKVTFENPLTKFDYEALKGTNVTGYYIYDNIEVLNGVIISLKNGTTSLSIPNTVVDLATSIQNISDKISSITTLSIDCPNIDKETPIIADTLRAFTNVNKFGISTATPKNDNLLTGLNKLDTLIIDSKDSFVTDTTVIPTAVKNLEVVGNGTLSKSLFTRFSSVQSLTVDNTVSNCVDGALEGLTSLKTLSMPYYPNITVNNLGVSANVESITFNKAYSTTLAPNFIDGYEKLTTLVLPREINRISDDFIKNCSLIAAINLPDNLTYIGNNFMYNCNNVTTLTVPAGVEIIMDNFIQSCSRLTSVEFLSTKSLSIGNNAFSNMNRLKNITFSDKTSEIGKYFITNCPTVSELIVPNNVVYLGTPFIGTGNNVGVVSVPFVGTQDNSTNYEYFNESYAKTTKLYIQKGISAYGYELFTEENNNITYLKIAGTITGSITNLFSKLTGLKNLYLVSGSSSLIKDVVGSTSLDSLVLTSSGKISSIFAGMTISNLVIKGGTIDTNTFVDAESIESLYISNAVTLSSPTFDKNVIGKIYFEGAPTLTIKDIPCYKNISYSIYKDDNSNVKELEKH